MIFCNAEAWMDFSVNVWRALWGFALGRRRRDFQ
jgi:hypothetical protein